MIPFPKYFSVLDGKDGNVLLSAKGSHQIYPGSVAKLMTALVAEELMKHCTLEAFLTRKEIVNDLDPLLASAGLVLGRSYRYATLLNAMLVCSGADATYVICAGLYEEAKNQRRGKRDEIDHWYAEQMTRKAKELRLWHTEFDNVIGLDVGDGYHHTRTTAIEGTKLLWHAMHSPAIRDAVGKKAYVVRDNDGEDAHTIHTTNQLAQYLPLREGAEWEYEVLGGKTGFTQAAGYNLTVCLGDRKGGQRVLGVFGEETLDDLYLKVLLLTKEVFK